MKVSPNRPTVFFDGGCPLCRREIAHYRRLDRHGRIHWFDVAEPGVQLDQFGLDRTAVMARFHVRDADGRMLTGAAAFVALWRCLPGYRHLARLVSALHLTGLLEWGYRRFAVWRLRRRCDDGLCTR